MLKYSRINSQEQYGLTIFLDGVSNRMYYYELIVGFEN